MELVKLIFRPMRVDMIDGLCTIPLMSGLYLSLDFSMAAAFCVSTSSASFLRASHRSDIYCRPDTEIAGLRAPRFHPLLESERGEHL